MVTVEVLGRQPFDGDVEDIAAACFDADCSGRVLSSQSSNTDATAMVTCEHGNQAWFGTECGDSHLD